MRTYIKNLQLKPEPVRKQMLVGLLSVSMLFVGTVWIYGLTAVAPGPTVADDSTESKPFALLRDSITNAYQNITASVGSISSSAPETSDSPSQKQVNLIPVEHTN